MIIVLFILWLLYSIFEGVREALSDTQLYNWSSKHVFYTLQRVLMATALTIAVFYIYGWWYCILFGAALILGFSFLHNGFYFLWRNEFAQVDVYPKGFFDKGTEKKLLNFSFITRTIMLVISLLIIIFCLIYENI